MMSEEGARYGPGDMVMAILFTLFIALLIGFIAGYLVRHRGIVILNRKRQQQQDNSKYDIPTKNVEIAMPDTSKRINIYENSPHQMQPISNQNHLLQSPLQSSLNSLDSRKTLNVVVNDIGSGKSSLGRNPNENIEPHKSPSKIKKQVYL